MAFATGSADDHRDLLVALRDFATGLIPSPVSGLTWFAERTDFVVGQEHELILRGNSGTSPETSLWVGVQTYSDPLTGLFGWDVRGFTSFDSGSPIGSTLFDAQPGVSPANTFVPLQDREMEYFFFGDERHLKGFIRTGNSYQPFYLGFLNRVGSSDDDYPYPMFIAGSSYVKRRYNDNSVEYRTFPSPHALNVSGTSPCVLRWTNGIWYDIYNEYGSTSTDFNDRGIWPMMPNNSTDSNPDHEMAQIRDFNTQYRANARTLWPAPGSPPCPVMFPCTIIMFDPTIEIVGEMIGTYWCSGQFLSPEDLVIDGESPEDRYMLFKSVHDTQPFNFGAMKIR